MILLLDGLYFLMIVYAQTRTKSISQTHQGYQLTQLLQATNMCRFQGKTAQFEVLKKGLNTPARAAPNAFDKVAQKN